MEHADCDQVVVDVAAWVARIHVNRIENCHKVLLTQSIDVVADDELEASEATSDNLITFMLQGLADRDNDDPPTFVFDLLAASLDDLFEALDNRKLVRVVVALELLSQRYQHSVLPRTVLPVFVSSASAASAATPLLLIPATLRLFH